MSLTIDQFIDAAANVGLLPPEVIESLRRLVEQSQGQAQARHLAKWLVDNKHLTPFQAKELLSGNLKTAGGATGGSSLNDDLDVVEDDELDVVEEEEPLEVVPDAGATRLMEPPPEVRAAPLPPAGAWSHPTRPSPPPPAPFPGSMTAPGPALLPGMPGAGGGWPGHPAGMSPAGAAAGWPGAPTQSPRLGEKKKSKRKAGAWDSPLLLIGGGLLLTLVLVGSFILWRIGQGNGDEALNDAETEYGRASYVQAVNLYDKYLKNFPQHKSVSIAKVHRGLAQMRLAVDGTSDWSKALHTAQEKIQEIETEKEFSQAQGELNAMLTKIAEGLKERARLAPTQQSVDDCQETLALIRRYVPRPQQQVEKIQDIEKSLALATRELQRTSRREEGLEKIQAAIAAGQPEVAYTIRNELIKTYPDLSLDEGLQGAIVAASSAEREQVRYQEGQTPAAAGDHADNLFGEIVLAPRSGGPAEGVEPGRILFVLAEGAAYGLEAATGKILWRRFVGFDTSFVPQATGAATGGDALLVDAVHHEIVRVEAATGKARWRHPLGEPIVDGPVPLRNKALVALRSGKIISLNLEDGAAAGQTQIPQTLRTSPVTDSRQRMVYQPGEHSNLYILSVETNRCEDVFYVGHAAGGIAVPPVVVGPYVILSENTGVSTGTLHVLLMNEQGVAPRKVQQVTLEGHILTPPMAAGKNLLVATDRGGLFAFEINTPDKDPPLVKSAEIGASSNRSLVRQLQLRNAQFWIADDRLTKYDVQVVQGKLAPKWVKFERDLFVQRPQVVGEYLVCCRRKAGSAGVVVSALRGADGSAAWEIQLGSPPACPPVQHGSGKGLTLLTAAGALFQVPFSGEGGQQVLDKPALTADTSEQPLGRGRLTLLEEGQAAVTLDAPAERFLYLDLRAGKRLPWVAVKQSLTGMAAGLDGRLLAAAQAGPLLLLDARSGASSAEPFMPALQAGADPVWKALAPTGAGECLAADGGNKLYKLALQPSPSPHLAAVREIDLSASVNSPIAVLDDWIYLVDSADRLLTFKLADLARGQEKQLDDKRAWGPQPVGQQVLLSTDAELICWRAGAEQWRQKLPYGPLSGPPLAMDDQILVAASRPERTVVYSVSAETGEETGRVEVGRPLSSGPLLVAGQLALVGHDGTIYRLKRDAIQPVP